MDEWLRYALKNWFSLISNFQLECQAEQSKEMHNLANEKHGSVSLEMFVASLLYHEQQQQQR